MKRLNNYDYLLLVIDFIVLVLLFIPMALYYLPHSLASEASGICDSISMPGNVWVHEDGDNPNVLHQFSYQGKYKGNVELPFSNRDWEDISIGAGPENNKNYIYLADIGDNGTFHSEYYIYRFLEPESLVNKEVKFDQITFKYADGSKNAECILLDPATKDIYIVTKVEGKAEIFRLLYPQSLTDVQTAQYIQTVPVSAVTSGGISNDGKTIALRTYNAIYYWFLKNNENIITALARKEDQIMTYSKEPQGEGFCFEKSNEGFFTISERSRWSKKPNFFFYFKK
ncbi:hypothetical protein EMA8858_02094 [Emticicia aquatica]|jgi:hypothetical protein|uniref:PE-PGRS family protein n=1 Tax=Emticicia aquatica TaxID=1681835 RepID=A0ABM9ARP5_9BACT|nr:PE-PGRS family protein [Emticicia aquatica]CAH0995966.1 hypothetical protein EMA8858_02094 [Emticicia aquatica]